MTDPLAAPEAPHPAKDEDVETAIEDVRRTLDWFDAHVQPVDVGEAAGKRSLAVHALNRLRCATRSSSSLQPGLRKLVESVTALESAARDDAPYGAWDTAKWNVFNAAVRFVKVEPFQNNSEPVGQPDLRALQPILDDMQRASDLVDQANGTSYYSVRLVALALVSRHFLRELAAFLVVKDTREP